jgi:hypothetical protein
MGTKQFSDLNSAAKLQIMLYAVLRKSGIPLNDFYHKMGIAEESFSKINTAVDLVANQHGDC